MRADIAPGGAFPDYELPDHTSTPRRLSQLQGDDPLILTLARGHYCPKEHQQHLELAAFYPKVAVAYTQIATISTDDHHTLQEFRASVGAQWAAAGGGLLVLLVEAFGPALARVPLTTLQLVVGILLLLFGMRWLRKAILRSAGAISARDEAAIYAEQTIALAGGSGAPAAGLDAVAVATAFKAVTLEGLEVIFIVIATGSTGSGLGR
jgi:uncharacterized membrane protein